MNRFVNIVILSFVMFTTGINLRAEDPPSVAIKWKHLAPEVNLFSDPFAELSTQQLREVSFVVRMNRLISQEKLSSDGYDAQKAEELARNLKQQGVDIPWLMAQRSRIRKLRKSSLQVHATSVAKKYDGKSVSLKGYVVPLKIDDELVTEFFLVPTIAHCRHELPPPPNQIVHVRSPQGFAWNDRTTAFNVTGTLLQRQFQERYGINSVAESVYAIEPASIEGVASQAKVKTDLHTTQEGTTPTSSP